MLKENQLILVLNSNVRSCKRNFKELAYCKVKTIIMAHKIIMIRLEKSILKKRKLTEFGFKVNQMYQV